jgi:hypothetical protein
MNRTQLHVLQRSDGTYLIHRGHHQQYPCSCAKVIFRCQLTWLLLMISVDYLIQYPMQPCLPASVEVRWDLPMPMMRLPTYLSWGQMLPIWATKDAGSLAGSVEVRYDLPNPLRMPATLPLLLRPEMTYLIHQGCRQPCLLCKGQKWPLIH